MDTGSQTIVFTERRSRRLGWFWLIALALLIPWMAWHIGVRWRDDYTSYSGVIVAKGEDYSLLDLFFTHHGGPDLYIVLQDEHGNRSKRYVGRSVEEWSALEVGSFVVKKKGFSESPTDPGKIVHPLSPSLPNTELSSRDFLFIGVFALVMFVLARLLWRFR